MENIAPPTTGMSEMTIENKSPVKNYHIEKAYRLMAVPDEGRDSYEISITFSPKEAQEWAEKKEEEPRVIHTAEEIQVFVMAQDVFNELMKKKAEEAAKAQ